MASKSVETKFATTPEEQIFGIDPYKAVSNTTLNNIVSKSNSFGGDIANLLGTIGDVASTAGVVSFITTGKLDKDYIVNKLGSTLKIDTSFIAKTPIANAGKLLQTMGLVDEKTANLLMGKDSSMSLVDIYTTAHNGYKTTVKNVKKVGDGFEQMGDDFEKFIKDDMFDSFSSFANVITSLDPNIANLIGTMGLSEELAILKNVVKQATTLEIPGLIDLIIKDVKDPKTQKAVLVQTLPDAVNASNTELLDSALDLLGGDMILGMYPTVVTDILMSYKDSSDTNMLPLNERATELFKLLERINKDWLYTYRDDVKVVNIDNFKSLSSAAKDILYACDNVTIRSAAMIGGYFKPEAPLIVAKKYYPYI